MQRIRMTAVMALAVMVVAVLSAMPASALVSPAVAPPIAVAQQVTTPLGVPLAITLTSTGGDANNSYAVTSTPGHGTLTGTAPNLTYTPVPSYVGPDQFTFHVANGNVTSANATVSITVTPTKPGAPAMGVVVPGDSQAVVNWSPPSVTGGRPITGYIVSVYTGVTLVGTIAFGPGTSQIVPGLQNGTGYWVKVAAVNALGTGPQSALSAPFVPGICGPFPNCSNAVTFAYESLLGRDPNLNELYAAVNSLNDRVVSLPSYIVSLRGLPDQTTNVDPVVRLYRAYFGRIPDAGGLTYWIGQRRAGKTIPAISSDFVGSSEFINQYGSLSNKAFVKLVYENVLERAGEPTGVAYWVGQLDSHKQTRGRVMVGFSESSEYKRTQSAEVNVSVLWILLLGRAPTETEFDNAVSYLQAGLPASTLVLDIMQTTEFYFHI